MPAVVTTLGWGVIVDPYSDRPVAARTVRGVRGGDLTFQHLGLLLFIGLDKL